MIARGGPLRHSITAGCLVCAARFASPNEGRLPEDGSEEEAALCTGFVVQLTNSQNLDNLNGSIVDICEVLHCRPQLPWFDR
jgi:hypothetical protein